MGTIQRKKAGSMFFFISRARLAANFNKLPVLTLDFIVTLRTDLKEILQLKKIYGSKLQTLLIGV